MATAPTFDYPAQFDVEYVDGRSRLTVFFRLILLIPMLVVSGLVTYSTRFLSLATVLMLLFRRRYPEPWFRWQLYLSQLTNRIGASALLLTDEYPSTTDAQRVTTEAQLDEAALSRWLPLVKWVLALPHYVALFFLGVAVAVVTVLAWIIIIVTGRYPRGMFEFVVGVSRWSWRVTAYVSLLNTDRYPPFSLK